MSSNRSVPIGWHAAITALLLTLVTSEALAATIRVEIATTVTTTERGVTVALVVRNLGDESARMLAPQIDLAGQTQMLPARADLSLGSATRWDSYSSRRIRSTRRVRSSMQAPPPPPSLA